MIPAPKLTDAQYQFLKWITQIFLPALGAFYFALDQVVGLPNAAKVVGVITAVDLFLGALLQKSSSDYAKSDERIDGEVDATGDELKVELEEDAVQQKDEVTLKVTKESMVEVPVEIISEATTEELDSPTDEKPKPKPRKRAPKKKV